MHGAPPAPKTLVGKVERLKGVMRTLSTDDEVLLASALSDRERVVLLLDQLYARQAPGTVRNVVVALRQYGQWAVSKGWIAHVAIEPNDAPTNVPAKAIAIYSSEELETLLLFARVRDRRYWAFLATLIETGRRVGEVLSLRWDQLRLDADVPHFDLPMTKNGRQNYVPLTTMLRRDVFTPRNIEWLQSNVHARIKGDPTVHPFPYVYQTAEQKLRRLCAAADVEDRGYHAFRHTKATSMLANGVPPQAVAALLGHSVQTLLRTYDHATALSYARYVG
jgi:integrase